MLTGLLIIAISLILLVYWLRVTCLLLLRREVATPIPTRIEHDLMYPLVRVEDNNSLDPLLQALERDYQVLTYLINHAAAIDLNPLEHRLLSADFQLMRWWYSLTRSQSPAQARRALDEMSSVVCFFAQRVGERASHHSRA